MLCLVSKGQRQVSEPSVTSAMARRKFSFLVTSTRKRARLMFGPASRHGVTVVRDRAVHGSTKRNAHAIFESRSPGDENE